VLFTANDYVQATREHRRMMVEMEPLYDRFDAFVTAGLGEAPRLTDYRSVSFWQKPSLLTAWNVTGQPVLALPNGFGRNGLPLGMQILGRPFGETTILRIGHAYEQATEWHRRRPALVPGAEAPAVTPPPVLSVTEPADAVTRDLCATAARRAGLRLDDQTLAQLLEGAPYALAMVERLRRDHGIQHEPANIFTFPPARLG
jgi:aspartyl-tRNA(Asn)/glutamyl-tRNA(Gln) amidotransferase subunit A